MDGWAFNQPNSLLTFSLPHPTIPGVPTMFVWAFKLCRPFMDKESYDNMLIRSDLKGMVIHPLSHLLLSYDVSRLAYTTTVTLALTRPSYLA